MLAGGTMRPTKSRSWFARLTNRKTYEDLAREARAQKGGA
jgi:hypothetical protein